MVKNLPAETGDMRNLGSIPGSGRSPEEIATHSSILAWRIPWTEDSVRLHTVHGVTKSWTWLKWLSTQHKERFNEHFIFYIELLYSMAWKCMNHVDSNFYKSENKEICSWLCWQIFYFIFYPIGERMHSTKRNCMEILISMFLSCFLKETVWILK